MRTILLCAIIALSMGCGHRADRDGADHRDPRRARRAYEDAMQVVGDHPDKAERLLREAIGYDLFLGPAHNNLGVLLLRKDWLYDAAEEFEWARKLMPGDPEPRCNLAVTLDRAGKSGEALDAVRAALEVAPGNLRGLQIIALIEVRDGLLEEGTPGYLDAIVLRGDPEWAAWARRERSKLPHPAHSD